MKLLFIILFHLNETYADILYIKLNPANTELAGVKKKAVERGEKLHIIPPDNETQVTKENLEIY